MTVKDLEKKIIILEGDKQRLDKKLTATQKEVERLTKAFLSLQEFYDDEKKLNKIYKKKLLEMGMVL